MNILLTNDDGIDAQGLPILAKCLSPWAKVWVCVPSEQQSGTGHGITVRETLRVREEKLEGTEKAWSVGGKPVDCVKLAFLVLMKESIDLVISGINEGTNLGTDTLYSGTVAGAMEGALYGVPAIAISLELKKDAGEPDFGPSAQICADLVSKWEKGALPIPPMSVLNVNVPGIPADKMKGYMAARLGIQRYSDLYEMLDASGDYSHYRLKGERMPSHDEDPGLDLNALAQGYVTLTPLTAIRTDAALLDEIVKFTETNF